MIIFLEIIKVTIYDYKNNKKKFKSDLFIEKYQ